MTHSPSSTLNSERGGDALYRKRKELLCAAALLLATALLVNFLSDVLRPARTDYGSTWSAYRAEPRNSIDVLYLGSSYAYCDINPALVYEAGGLTGYVMAGSEQTLSLTYWYLKEALKTQTPQAVVLEGTGFFFDTYQNYTQINAGYLPFGLNKLGAIFTASKPDLRAGLLFDLYFYHDRWKEIGPGDLKKALFPIRADHYKGHTAVDKVLEDPQLTTRTWDTSLLEEHRYWLRKILALCTKNGVLPIVVFNPTYSRAAPEDRALVEQTVREAAPEALFFDWTADFASIGLDPALHLYDAGHLNQDGAAIFSAWLGGFLRDEIKLTPRPQTGENAAAWDAAVQWWRHYLG